MGGRGRVPYDLDRPGRTLPGLHPGIRRILFRHWVLPFEALSVLLLAALVGAIVLSRKDTKASQDAKGAKAPEGKS